MLKRYRVEKLGGKPERIYYTLTEKGRKTLIELTRP
jgi:DNA-binding PadR family transcriptional regulator